MNAKPMRIGQLARKSGKTSRTLHFYEEKGLLRPTGRTKGGFRLYDERALVRIQWIERLQDLGFSLQEIQDFLARLSEEQSAPDAMTRLRAFYAEKLSETRSTLRRLQALESDLHASIEYLDGCTPCDPLTHRGDCGTCTLQDRDSAPDLVRAVTNSP